MRFSQTEARYGTLQPKLPILVANDGRVLPQTFEGGMITSKEVDNLTLVGGRLEHATGRGSSNRSGFAVAGGTQQSNEFLFAGADYKLTKDLTLQYYTSRLEDYYVQHFGGLVHVLPLGEGQSLTYEQLERIHRCKTGALIEASVVLGARAARTTPERLAAISRYGRCIGLAFQIADDVLDVTATSDQLGKTAGKDLVFHKSTYPALLGIEGAISRAEALVQEGCDALASAGVLTPLLEATARYMVARRS